MPTVVLPLPLSPTNPRVSPLWMPKVTPSTALISATFFWKRMPEVIGKYLKKGDKVYLEGRLQTREWEDKNKIKRYQTEIVASNMIMLGGKNGKSTKNEKVEDDVVVEEVSLKSALPQEA